MTSRESSEPDVPPTRKIITADDYDKARSKEFLPYKDFALVEGDKPIVTSEFTCPICLDLLFKTVTAKDCLHRFCSDCINMALHKGNRECPTCRSKIISKRDLRSDKRFDAIVKAMWPDRQEYARIVREYEEANQKESTDYYRALEKPDSAIVMENIRNLTKPVNTHDLEMEPDEGRAKRVVNNFSKAMNLLNEDGDLEKCLDIIGTCKPVPTNKSGREETPDEESTTSLLKTVIPYNTLEEVLEAVPMLSSEEDEGSDEDESDEGESEYSVHDPMMVSVKSEKFALDGENRNESSNANTEQRGLKRKHQDSGKSEAQLSQATEPETKKVKAEGAVQTTAISGSANDGVSRKTERKNFPDCQENDPQSSQKGTAQTSTSMEDHEHQRTEIRIGAENEEEDDEDEEDEEEYEDEDEEEEEENNRTIGVVNNVGVARNAGNTPNVKKFRNYATRTVFPAGESRESRLLQTLVSARTAEDLNQGVDRQVKIVPISDLHPDQDSSEDEEAYDLDEEYSGEEEEEFEDENGEYGAEDEEEEEEEEDEEYNEYVGQEGQAIDEEYYDDEECEDEEYDAEELVRLTQQHFEDMQNLYLRNFLAGLLDTYTDKNLRWKVNFRQMFMEEPPEVEINDVFFSYICKRRYKSVNKHPEFTAYYYMKTSNQPKDKYNRRSNLFHELMFGDRNLDKIDDCFEKTYKREILDTSRIHSPGEFGNFDIFYNESEEDEFAGVETDDEHEKMLKECDMDGAYVAELKPFLQPLDLGVSSCSSSEDEKTKNFVKKKVRKNRYYNSRHARLGSAYYFDEKYSRDKQLELDERAKYLMLKDALRNAKSGEESKECSEVTSESSDEEIREETNTLSSEQPENTTEANAGRSLIEETGRMDVDVVEEDEGNDADDEDNSDEGSELTDDSDTMNGLTDESDSDGEVEYRLPLLDRLVLMAKLKHKDKKFDITPESSDFGTDSDRETTYHNNRCGLPKVSREFMEYVQHSRIWFTILKHPYNRTKLFLKRSAKFYLRAWRDTQSGVYEAAALRGEEFLPEHPECAFPKVFYEYNTFFKSRPKPAVKRYWRSDVLIKPEFAASNRSMCHVDTIMKKSNYFGLDDYIDDEEIYVDPELYDDSFSSDSCYSEIDDDEYHDSGKYRADVENIVKNHNFAEILEGLPDFEKHAEVMKALDDLRGLIVQYKRMRSNCLDFMSSILPMNSPLRYFRVAECDLRYAAEIYEPIYVEDKAEYRKRNRVVEIDDDDDEEQDYSSNSEYSEYTENYSFNGDFERYEENDYQDISESREHLDDMNGVEADEMEICEESIKSDYCEDLKDSQIVANFDMIERNESETREVSGESNRSLRSENSEESSSSEYEDVSDDEAGDFERKVEDMTSEQQEKLLLELVNEIEKEIGGDYNKLLNQLLETESEPESSDGMEYESDERCEGESEPDTEDESDASEETSEEESDEASDVDSDAISEMGDVSRKELRQVSIANADMISKEGFEETSEDDSDVTSEDTDDTSAEISQMLIEDVSEEETTSGDESDEISEPDFETHSGAETDGTSREKYEGLSGDDSDNSSSEDSEESSEEVSESASDEKMQEESCNDSEGTSGEDVEDVPEESEGIDYESGEESDCMADSEEASMKESVKEESDDVDKEELEMEIDGNSGESEGNYCESSEGQSSVEHTDVSEGESEERSEGEFEEGSEEELEEELEEDSGEGSDEEPEEESDEESGEESDHACEQNIRIFTKELEKLSRNSYVNLDQDDEEELYGELEETESYMSGSKYNQHSDQWRKSFAQETPKEPAEIENNKYNEKWDYTHANMVYEKIKEEDDVFDLKSRPSILDPFKSRRVYDPANFNARKNFALVPLYDDYGLRSYNPDPREDAPAIQSIINSNY